MNVIALGESVHKFVENSVTEKLTGQLIKYDNDVSAIEDKHMTRLRKSVAICP